MNPPSTSQTLSIEQAIELALTYHRAGQLAQAESIYQQILAAAPEHAVAMQFLGVILYQRSQFDQAEKLMLRSIELFPGQPGYHNNLGELYRAKKQFDRAQSEFEKALQLDPKDYHAHNNLALLYMDQDRLSEARPLLDAAVRLMPENPTAICNIGVVQERLGQFKEGRKTLEEAIRLNPSLAPAYVNLSTVLNGLNCIDEALAAADKAIEFAPQDPTAHLSRSNALFHLGRMKEAWPEYEWRLEKYPFLKRHFLEPQWDGGDLKGRTILLYCEQGFGDAIQFVRYAKLVRARGAGKVILECLPALMPLLSSAQGIDQVVQKGMSPPKFDVQCSLLRLPSLFQTEMESIPAEVGYLRPDPQRVDYWATQMRAQNDGRLRVGLSWAGSPAHEKDRLRSCRLSDFAPLAQVEGIVFYSLQKGIAADQAFDPPAGMTLIDQTLMLTDFAESAALVANLDLVITVDTATAHLAAALGKPTWAMLAFVPEWRWQHDRADSPWYPTLRLFRQSRFGQWSDPVSQIVQALREKR